MPILCSREAVRIACVAIACATLPLSVAGADPDPDWSDAFREGEVLDVKLGALSNVQQLFGAHDGPYPNGRVGLSMSTTSCNVGTVNVPWHRPMEEDHPFIAMHLYRNMGGRFEQVGVSWVKHAFFALSDNACTPCQNPTGGTELGVGCSDTYSPGNNGDRRYLGPREEIDPYTGTWPCESSYFSGGEPDCIDRRDTSGLDPVDHRLEVIDGDLDLPGAEYVYEAYYVVAGDQNKMDNIGSRLCTMSWNGASWTFSTPAQDNDLLEGPALQRWGEMQSWVEIGSTDGRVILAVETTDLGDGAWRYEYALFNFDSDRRIRSLTLPTGDGSPTDVTFHDWDQDPANDWVVEETLGALTWSTDTFDTNPDANALSWGLLFNFGFTQTAEPVDATGSLGVFAPAVPARGEPDVVSVTTRAPDKAVPVLPGSAASGVTPAIARIGAPTPNPTGLGTVVPFALEMPSRVSLAIYDAGGRHVRTLIDAREMSVGAHRVPWDGRSADGERVGAGVYFARLAVGDVQIGGRSIVVTR